MAVHKTGLLQRPFIALALGRRHQEQEQVGLTLLPDLLKRCTVTALLPSGSASTLLVFLALCASVLADTFGSFLGGLGRRTGSMLQPQAPYQLAPPIGRGTTDLTRNRLYSRAGQNARLKAVEDSRTPEAHQSGSACCTQRAVKCR